MNEVPEKGRDTTGQGRATDPHRNDHLDGAGRVSHPFSPGRVRFSPETDRVGVRPDPSGDGGRGGAVAVETVVGRVREPADKHDRVRSSDGTLGPSVSEARGNVKSSERGIPSVAVRGEKRAVRYRTLPYASAVVQTPTDEEYSASLGSGGS